MTEPDGIDFNQDELADELRAAFGIGGGGDEPAIELNLAAGLASSAAANRMPDEGGLPIGTRIGDFRIVEELGHGGMGVVYRAMQLSLDREVALKILPKRARQGRTTIQRFRSEARAAARLHHTNIVPVFAHGDDNGQFYYAMDLVEGGSLDQAIRYRTRLLSPSNRTLMESVHRESASSADTIRVDRSEPVEVDFRPTDEPPVEMDVKALQRASSDYRHLARLIAEVADGLDHAHSHGVIHRDIKPHNLLVGPDNRLHITDFGLARLVDEPTLTASGEVMGTPFYLSPEMIDTSKGGVDHRTDIYSLGVTFYELLTLQRAVTGETRDQILTGIRTQQPCPPRRLDGRIPRDLETICLKAMEKDPKYRYATAAEMAVDLQRFADGRPILSRRIGWIGRGIKWAKRNRAASFALVTTCVMLVLGAGLVLSVSGSRKDKASRLLRGNYDQLIYSDYHKTEGIRAQLDEAERLGGDAVAVAFLRGLSNGCLQGDRASCSEAIEDLESVRAEVDSNAEYAYALACLYDRNEQESKARALIEEADGLDEISAEAWFLRGLALHWDDSDEAIRSYEQARDMRAQDGAFFMQATLQLARAHNQRMFTFRSIDDYGQSRRALESLIDNKVYKGYPYYLLSIAERIAGEIYRGSSGTRDDSVADGHFEQSLAIAREGQQVDPDNPSPHSAEAFCLEAMGRYEDAIAAQTRVVELGEAEQDRWCEALHYRWRLNYWVGAFDEAMSDVERHRTCAYDNESFFYAHVYPMLIEAERGDMDAAKAHAVAIAQENPGDASAWIWTVTSLRLLGETRAVAAHMGESFSDIALSPGPQAYETEEWKSALLAMVRGEKPLAELLLLADEGENAWWARGEAEFHAAAIDFANGARESALAGFKRAYRSFDRATRYTYHADILVRKMEMDPDWPPWIGVNTLDSDASNVVKP